jgi:hypothetical protein
MEVSPVANAITPAGYRRPKAASTLTLGARNALEAGFGAATSAAMDAGTETVVEYVRSWQALKGRPRGHGCPGGLRRTANPLRCRSR